MEKIKIRVNSFTAHIRGNNKNVSRETFGKEKKTHNESFFLRIILC